jgi:hypothetical protein
MLAVIPADITYKIKHLHVNKYKFRTSFWMYINNVEREG